MEQRFTIFISLLSCRQVVQPLDRFLRKTCYECIEFILEFPEKVIIFVYLYWYTKIYCKDYGSYTNYIERISGKAGIYVCTRR